MLALHVVFNKGGGWVERRCKPVIFVCGKEPDTEGEVRGAPIPRCTLGNQAVQQFHLHAHTCCAPVCVHT